MCACDEVKVCVHVMRCWCVHVMRCRCKTGGLRGCKKGQTCNPLNSSCSHFTEETLLTTNCHLVSGPLV